MLEIPESIYLVLNTQFYQPRNLLKGTLILWKCFKAILYNGFAVKFVSRLKYRRFNHILNLLYNTVFGIQPQKQKNIKLTFSLSPLSLPAHFNFQIPLCLSLALAFTLLSLFPSILFPLPMTFQHINSQHCFLSLKSTRTWEICPFQICTCR